MVEVFTKPRTDAESKRQYFAKARMVPLFRTTATLRC